MSDQPIPDLFVIPESLDPRNEFVSVELGEPSNLLPIRHLQIAGLNQDVSGVLAQVDQAPDVALPLTEQGSMLPAQLQELGRRCCEVARAPDIPRHLRNDGVRESRG
jgi:hypothetical protein